LQHYCVNVNYTMKKLNLNQDVIGILNSSCCLIYLLLDTLFKDYKWITPSNNLKIQFLFVIIGFLTVSKSIKTSNLLIITIFVNSLFLILIALIIAFTLESSSEIFLIGSIGMFIGHSMNLLVNNRKSIFCFRK
jgi:hypothetical protein